MIVLSLILVVGAAALLVAGFFQTEGLELVYSSIGACVLAMIFLGIGVLQRRRASEPVSETGGYGPGGASAPVRPSGPAASRPSGRTEDTVERRSEPEPAEAEVAEEEPAPRGTTGQAARERLARVKGVGPAKQDRLLERFGSLEAIAAATVDEIMQVRGFGGDTAVRVKQELSGR